MARKKVTIIRGEKRTISVTIVEEDSLEAYDLTGNSEIKVCLKNQDGTTLELTKTGTQVTVVSEIKGKISFVVSETDSPNLKVGDDQDIEIEITKSSDKRIVQVKQSLDVENRLC